MDETKKALEDVISQGFEIRLSPYFESTGGFKIELEKGGDIAQRTIMRNMNHVELWSLLFDMVRDHGYGIFAEGGD